MAREVFNMDFDWRFHRGDINLEFGKKHDDIYMSCKAGRTPGVPAKDFDHSGWRQVDLPHDFFTESEFNSENLSSHGYRERTNGWYRKTFKLPEELEGKQLLLCFEGTAVNAEFYFNGSIMERSFSAYTETVFDITDRAYFGEALNTLAVYIKGLTVEGWWYEGAGIYRHVKLYAKDNLHIAHNGVFAKPVLADEAQNKWNVVLKTMVENSSYTADTVDIKAELSFKGEKVAESVLHGFNIALCQKSEAEQSFEVLNPARWDIDEPNLYDLKVAVLKDGEELDAFDTRIGFRTAAYDKNGFILNGRRVFLKGTCNHQDHAGCGVAVPDSVHYWRIKKLKEMGTNAYRCSHNMVSKEVLDACDEIGMIVMDENRRFETRKEVLEYLEIMVRRDCNHPSVIFYSLFNEEPLQTTDEGAKMYRRMKAFVQNLDNSRIMTGAINGNIEKAGLEMDVAGCNYNLSAIEGMHAAHPERPILGAENNSAVTTRGCYKTDRANNVLSNYDEEAVPWGQTIGQTWNFVRKHDYFGGIFIWTGFDYRGEPSPFVWPSVSSQFGIMDTCGFPKDSYYFNKACFTDTPMVHILPHWNWNKGDTVRVMTVSNCEEVELFLNGKSLGKKADDLCRHAEWQVEFEAGTISAKAYKGGKCVAEASHTTTGKPVAIKLMPNTTVIKNDGHDTVLVDCCVVDSEGRIVPTADNHITFEVLGDGIMRGVGNGNPNSHESDILPERDLFAGYAQMLLMSKLGAEKITVKAHSDGLSSAEIVFDVKKVDARKAIFSAASRDVAWFTASEIYYSKPDPLVKVSDNDNNSFLPITFQTGIYQTDFTNGWRIYRARPKSTEAGEYTLQLANVKAEKLEVYVNNTLLFAGDKAIHGEKIECKFTANADEVQEIRILVYAQNAGSSGAGLAEAVRMFK